MKINSILLKNYRCYADKRLDFKSNKVILVGPNAIGKTSLIEAIYLLGLAKSPRNTKDIDLIKNGTDTFYIEGLFENKLNNFKVSIAYNGINKNLKKENTSIKKMTDFLGTVDVVWFSSADLNLVSGNPQERRVNFDRIICQISKVYCLALSNYKKFLKERNALLKRLIFENNNNNIILLNIITGKLIIEAKKIISIRSKIVNKINEMMKDKHLLIGSKDENVGVSYVPNADPNTLEELLMQSIDDDIKHGNTGFGPHKDDYIFIINNKNIATYASQGQQRDAILSLKLSEVDLIFEVKNETPILLLDDVFSELDKKRQNYLIKSLKDDVQTIITTTSIVEIDEEILKNATIVDMKGDC